MSRIRDELPEKLPGVVRTVCLLISEDKNFVQLREDQLQDLEISQIKQYIEDQLTDKNTWSKHLKDQLSKNISNYIIEKGWLMFSEGGSRVLVIPQSKREPLLNQYHNGPLGGHMSSRKTESKLRQKYYWPGIIEEIKNDYNNARYERQE